MIGDSRDSGGRPPVHLVSTEFSTQGCGHLLWPLISEREVVPPGFLWIRQGGGLTTTTRPRGRRREQNWVRQTRLGMLAFRRGQSDTQRLCQTNRLGGCWICSACQPLQQNNIAPELGESKQAREVLTT